MNQSEEDDFKIELKTSQARRTYLVTYSQADLSKFPTRQSFGEQVVAYFNAGSGKVEVEHWACCQESIPAGVHYHLLLKLSGPKRWKWVKEKLMDNHGVVVNFSDGHDNYYTACRYVTKQDAEVYHSVGHPNLNETGSPKTKNCIHPYRSARKKRSLSVDAQKKNAEKEKPGKVRPLNNLEVSEFITENNVKGYTKLLALAEAQKMEGKKRFGKFYLVQNHQGS